MPPPLGMGVSPVWPAELVLTGPGSYNPPPMQTPTRANVLSTAGEEPDPTDQALAEQATPRGCHWLCQWRAEPDCQTYLAHSLWHAWPPRARALCLLAGVALALRLTVVLLLWSPQSRPLAYEHGQIAENLLAGKGFSIEFLGVEGPTSQQAPFYPLLLVPFYAILGPGTPAAILAVELLQCLAGTLLVLAVVWLAWAVVPERPEWGWIAGLLAAVHPTHLYMVTHLQVALWAALVLTCLLALSVSNWRGDRWHGPCAAGALAGVLVLIEPILGLALPVVAAVWWSNARRNGPGATWVSAAKAPLIVVAAATMVIAPWTVRNRLVHGQWVFIKSTFGYAFWQGNHPLSWGTDKIPKATAETIRQEHDGTLAGMNRALWEARHETLYIDDVVLKPNGYARFQGLSEPDRSALLGREAIGFLRADPARYACLCLTRLRYFLLFDETNPKAANLVYRASTVAWLMLAGWGLVVSRAWWRRLWPTYVLFAAVMIFHALVIVSTRFRIPVEPLSLVWAGAALGWGWTGLRRWAGVRPNCLA